MTKELIGLAGEFAVASELCRRGVYAQPTFGNRKRTDLLIIAEDRVRRIEVKAKQGQTWPSVAGIDGQDILVLVDFSGKQLTDRADFYIINSEDWVAFCRQHTAANEGSALDGTVVVYKSGWRGASVTAEDFRHCLECWDKV